MAFPPQPYLMIFALLTLLVFHSRLSQEQKIADRDKDQSIAPTSFLWNAYLPKCYYYEVSPSTGCVTVAVECNQCA